MKELRRDPLTPLLATENGALLYLARRDLLGEPSTPIATLWESPDVLRAVARQRPDGGWTYPGGNPEIRSPAAYDQLETYRQLAVLVGKFGLDRRHPAVAPAAAFLSSFQRENTGNTRGAFTFPPHRQRRMNVPVGHEQGGVDAVGTVIWSNERAEPGDVEVAASGKRRRGNRGPREP